MLNMSSSLLTIATAMLKEDTIHIDSSMAWSALISVMAQDMYEFCASSEIHEIQLLSETLLTVDAIAGARKKTYMPINHVPLVVFLISAYDASSLPPDETVRLLASSHHTSVAIVKLDRAATKTC